MADSVKIKITGDSKPFNDELDKLGKKAKSAVSGAGSVFKGIMASQIVTKGVSMLTGGLRDAITTGMQFEAAMSQVAAISGATGQELELLTETAKHYGETTAFSASQAAEALNYMALAGWDAQQSVDALGGVLDLAAASGMDLGRASDAVTDYLSAFSMEASQAGYMADLMAYAQSRSNTSASQLADAYGNCASSMHAAGQDIETTTAMLMALANQGIKGGEAGTQMAAVMRDLTQKMDKGQIMIGKTAVKVTDAAGNFRDLNDIIMDVGKATEGMGTAEQSAAIMETFTARSVKAIQTILNEGVENVNQYEEALRGSEGTAAEQAKIMMDNLQGDIKIFKSALEGVQITASESMNTTARAIVQEGTGFLEAINQGGKTGGIGGMFDAVIDQIPALLPKATKRVETLLGGVGKRLPGLVTGLIKTLPSVLSSAGGLAPILIDSLTSAAGAAVEGLITNLPNLVGSLASALPGVLASTFKGVGGILGSIVKGVAMSGVDQNFREYESLGTITGTVDIDATVDYAAAQKEIDDQLGEFVAYLEGLGLTTEQVAQVLAFKGTPEELTAWLDKNFPDLDAAAKEAIKAKFTATGEGGLASLFAEGEKYGLSAEDIAGVLVDTEGMSEAQIQECLESRFPDLSQAAKNAIIAKLPEGGWQESLKAELEGKGIAPADIAAILTATTEGDTDTVESILTTKYAGIKDEVMNAVKAAIPEEGMGASLVSELTNMGIKPADIVAILTAQSEGDTDTVESLLTDKYKNIKDEARAAITKAWNAGGEVSSGADQASTGFAAQLIVDMFTDGISESEADITAALETAKGIIERKKAELQALIDSGVLTEEERSEAQAAIEELNSLGSELDSYTADYANASTETCRVAGENLTAIAAQVDSTLEHVLGKHQELQSFQGKLFSAGAGGAQLSDEDTLHALGFIKGQLDKELEEAAKAKEEAIKAGESYDEVNETYLSKVEASQTRARARVAALAAGQASGKEGATVAAALSSIWGDLLEGGGLGGINTAEVEQMLRDKGFDGDVLNEALMTIMTGPNGILNLEGLGEFKGTEGLAALNLTEEVSGLIAEIVGEGFSDPAIFANELQGMEGVSNELLNQILLTMFGTGGEVQLPNVDEILSGVDFGNVGRLVRTAAEQNLIEGVSSDQAKDSQFMQRLIGDLVGEGFTADPVNVNVPVVTTPEPQNDPASEITDAVQEETNGEAEGTVTVTQDVEANVGDVTVNGAEEIGQQVDTLAASGNTGSALSGATTQAVGSAISGGTSAASGASSIGVAIARGIASGISSNSSIIAAAARSAAQAALTAAKTALDSHSPSKEMMKVGRWYDQGFALGIDKSASEVVRSALMMAKSAVGAANLRPKFDTADLFGKVEDGLQTFADAETQRPVVLVLNGRKVAESLAPDTSKAQGAYNRHVSMGYGTR